MIARLAHLVYEGLYVGRVSQVVFSVNRKPERLCWKGDRFTINSRVDNSCYDLVHSWFNALSNLI